MLIIKIPDKRIKDDIKIKLFLRNLLEQLIYQSLSLWRFLYNLVQLGQLMIISAPRLPTLRYTRLQLAATEAERACIDRFRKLRLLELCCGISFGRRGAEKPGTA